MKNVSLLTTAAALLFSSAPAPAASDEYTLVLWNQYNGEAKDRGTKACKVEVFSGGSVLWKQERVELEWKPGTDTKSSIAIPKQIATIDRVRVSITETHGNGGGLAEIELHRQGENLAPKCQVAASGHFKNDQRFSPKRAIDGITSSEKMFVGYWLLPDDKTGWIELKLPRR